MNSPEENKLSKQRAIKELFCSVITSIGKICIVQPFDFLRFRVQSSIQKSSSVYQLISGILKKEGFYSFYKGTSITSFMIFFNSTFNLTLFQETLSYFKTEYLANHNNEGKDRSYFLKSKSKLNVKILCNNHGMDFLSANNLMSWIYFKAGFFSGMVTSIFFVPFDNVRIRLLCEKAGIPSSLSRLYIGNWSTFSKIIKHEGLRGLFVGFQLSVIKESLATGIYFSHFEYTSNLLNRYQKKNNFKLFKTFISGAAAGIMNWIITLPFDVLRTRLISKIMNSKHQISAVVLGKKILKDEGVSGLYKGFNVIMLRAMIVNGVALTLFEYLRLELDLK